jgi:hypothetical protein
MSYGNEPAKAPDIEGIGKAWKVPRTSAHDEVADWGGDCGQWLVYDGTRAHPFWWWYVVGCVHLRPLEGQSKPPVVDFPGATHEIMFLALNPEVPLPDLGDWQGASFLQPADLVRQFIVNDDLQARELCELVVRHICDGHSPDVDFRHYWEAAIDSSAEHARLGGHPDA